MKKNYILLTAFLFIGQVIFSQTVPIVAAQKSFGGNNNDRGKIIRKTPDKGFIVAANTASTSIPGFHGLTDFWIRKFNKKGKVEWSKCYGGGLDEYATAIELTNDNGYIISGTTTSNDGDVTGHHGVGYDVWIVKIDSVGNIQWSKCYGGSDYDNEAHIIPTDDGGYIFAATSGSLDGDLTNVPGPGWYDIWVVKISSTGTIEWQKKYGGGEGDFAGSIKKVTGGGYIIGGATYSQLPGKHGADAQDCYVLRIDNTGGLIWQKCYGGTSEEGYALIKNTPEGGFIFVTTASSGDGDVTGVHSPYEDEFFVYDVWLVKLSATGAIEWQKIFGGYADDYGEDVQKTSDGGYIVCGSATSTDGDVAGNHGDGDAWIIKTTSDGTMEWQLCAGGSLNEGAASITSDFGNGNYIFTGSNRSSDGDCTSNNGLDDLWVVQLSPGATTIAATDNQSGITTKINKLSVYPNPVQSIAYINFTAAKGNDYTITVNDISGKQVLQKSHKAVAGENKVSFNVANLAKGIYFIKLQQGATIISTEKLIKN